MKRIDFIVAGIISAVWAIITCIYCGQGGTISLDNHIDTGNGWYIPLPSRYWDWLYIGLFYIIIVSYLRGHWLPDRKHVTSYTIRDELDALLFLGTFVISGIIVIKVLITFRHKDGLGIDYTDIPLVLILSCITARRGTLKFILMFGILAVGLVHFSVFGWYFATLATLIILTAKVLIWLAVNTFRSGFTMAWQQLRMSLMTGRKIIGETGHLNSSPSQERTGTQDAKIHFRRESSPR